jgi:fatty acid desaturase
VAVPLFGLPRPWLKRLIERLLRGDDADVQAVRRQVVAALTSSRLGRIRADALVTILLYGTSLWLYGQYSPWLVAQLAVRGFLISVLDNAFHYGTPLDSGRDALNFALPRFWARAILNFNYHHAHHHRPSLSWIALPRVESSLRQSSHPFLGGLARQFRGPIPLDAVLR